MIESLFSFLGEAVSPFHAAAIAAKMLDSAGYERLEEGEQWNLLPGAGYYFTRNGSSLLAFRAPEPDFSGYMITAAHSDSPTFRIRENPEISDEHAIRLSCEKYGGMLCSTWFDRPLSIAGRVAVRTSVGIRMHLVNLKEPVCIIPSVAIHQNRKANENASYNPAIDMLPLYGTEKAKIPLRDRVAQAAGVLPDDILASELSLYVPDSGTEWGAGTATCISAPRLDDLSCAFASLTAFLQAERGHNAPVFCLFDNEEIGSETKQGAASAMMEHALARIAEASGLTPGSWRQKLASSFLISCDNAHAVHPNHPELADKSGAVYLNGGIVIKHNANKKYATDAVSAAIFRMFCREVGISCQNFVNRADMPGGSTLGSIAETRVPMNTVDIGLPQLAMHSALETAGSRDLSDLIRVLTLFFSKQIVTRGDGEYSFPG